MTLQAELPIWQIFNIKCDMGIIKELQGKRVTISCGAIYVAHMGPRESCNMLTCILCMRVVDVG